MSDLTVTNPVSDPLISEEVQTSQPSLQVENPDIKRHDDDKAPVQTETISIVERAVRAHDQIMSLTNVHEILDIIAVDTGKDIAQVQEDLSRDCFQNQDDFEKHIIAFKDSILAANDSLKIEETPITLISAYQAYRDCRLFILNNLDAETFYWNSKTLTFLPPEIALFTKVTIISLFENKLSSLPAGLFTLKTLTKLTLNDNIIAYLPPLSQTLPNLTALYIMSNRLNALPDNIGMLPNLNSLYLGNNNLSELPEDLLTLVHLSSLHLGGNQLCELPSNIDKLVNLKMLTAWDNKLSSLPPAIANMKHLSKLYLNNNQFQKMPSEIDSIKFFDFNISLNPFNK